MAEIKYDDRDLNSESVVQQQPAYNADTKYTIHDLENWSEDERVELIDGMVYNMTSPMTIHQRLVVNLSNKIYSFIQDRKGKCEVFVAPCDVLPDPADETTVLQPDVFVVCDPDKIKDKCILGAPDLVIEILSLSTRQRDRGIKKHKYAAAGVREYWLVDPDASDVQVFHFEKDGELDIGRSYSFSEPIPVAIYNGELMIILSD